MSSTPLPETTITQPEGLAVVLPEPIIVKIPRENNVVEDLKIMPIPFRKWRVAFRYIAQVAPLFGFNLADASLDDLEKAGDAKIDKQTIFQAMQGDDADVIYEFLAFALGKFKTDGTPDISFFDDIYEQAIDIALGVILVNINFFIQRLLPRVLQGTKQLTETVALNKASIKTAATSTNGQPQ